VSDFDHTEPVEDWKPGPEITRELYLQWRSPRFGSGNPERVDNPVWQWLARTRIDAFRANQHFDGPSAFDAGPAWCCHRNGQSRTRLADGRFVRIGGEHEDWYDPDFHIYNDVIVDEPDGSCRILGYPAEAFPPTDFHSATLVGDRIVVIGCLGYVDERRPDATPVFALDTATWKFSSPATAGEAPGWIHRHEARLSSDGAAIEVRGGLLTREGLRYFVENTEDWCLDLRTWQWERLTQRCWQQCVFARQDGRTNSLFEFRSAGWFRQWQRDQELREMYEQQIADLTERIGAPLDLDLVERIYRPAVGHEVVPPAPDSDEHGVFRIRIDGVVLRFVEGRSSVRLVVEGRLSAATVEAVVDEVRGKLASLERSDYEVTPVRPAALD
jgi:hypothetical protein